MPEATIRTKLPAYVLLAVLTACAVAIQVRLSLSTVHLQRTLAVYVHFLTEPFTGRVDALSYSSNWEQGCLPEHGVSSWSVLRLGDRVTGVNGRPYIGISSYLIQLWNYPRQDSDAFVVTVVDKGGRTRNIEFSSPHCTCGIPTLFEALFFWMAVPLFCIVAGTTTAAIRPTSALAWTFFVLMLSLSQLQFWDEPYTGFQLTANPVAWSNAMRIPAVGYRELVQHIWPAVLAIAAIQLSGRSGRMHPVQSGFIAIVLLVAVTKAGVAIAAAEGIQSLSAVYLAMVQYKTEGLALCFLLATAAAWTGGYRLGIPAAVITASALWALFGGPAPVTDGRWEIYSENLRHFKLSIPENHLTPGLIVASSVTAFVLSSLAMYRRRLSWLPILAGVLCLPLATHVCASLGNWWWAFLGPSIEIWPWIVVLTAGAGIALASFWIVKLNLPR